MDFQTNNFKTAHLVKHWAEWYKSKFNIQSLFKMD